MKTMFAAALLAVSVAGIGTVSAMPVAPSSAGTDVIHVAGGCGPGFHRGPYGGCRANRAVVVVRPAVVAPSVVVVRPGRRCPPGQGMTRFGCRWR